MSVIDRLLERGEELVAAPSSVLGTHDVVSVTGSDARSFLQGQLAQDLDALEPERPLASLLLEPDGRLGHLLRVGVDDDGGHLLIGARGGAESVAERLDRFRFRVNVTVEVTERALVAGSSPAGAGVLVGERLHGVAERLVDEPAAGDGVLVLEAYCLARRRLTSADVRESMNPYELGRELVDSAVSFTKGCYTGQELVARIDARSAAAPQRLCWLSATEPLACGSVLVGDDEVGTVERVVTDGATGHSWGSARIARRLELVEAVRCSVDGVDGTLQPF
jgi:folate-binding protein YgfZ